VKNGPEKEFVELNSKSQSITDSFNVSDSFAISFESSDDFTDENIVVEQLKKKSVPFKDALSNSSVNIVLKCGDTEFAGHYVVVGQNLPIKHGSVLRFELTPRRFIQTTSGI